MALCLSIRIKAVTANLEMSAYSVVEGMLQLSVCANLSEAIERDVAVGISTSSGSASGMLTTIFFESFPYRYLYSNISL